MTPTSRKKDSTGEADFGDVELIFLDDAEEYARFERAAAHALGLSAGELIRRLETNDLDGLPHRAVARVAMLRPARETTPKPDRR